MDADSGPICCVSLSTISLTLPEASARAPPSSPMAALTAPSAADAARISLAALKTCSAALPDFASPSVRTVFHAARPAAQLLATFPSVIVLVVCVILVPSTFRICFSYF
jgi:hypothetical protein